MILNTFPSLLSFSFLSPMILRLVLGFIALNLGFLKITSESELWRKLFETINFHPAGFFVKLLAAIETIGGILLLLGAYTQITAIVFALLFFCEAILEYRDDELERRSITFYILVFAIALSLVFSGAGAFALDLPL